ncbi:MAG: chromosome segregation protein SMC [Candidatus Brocadiales bacterium]
MQLTKLEVFGFKSFADKIAFTFEPGITVIVGPNGCGKSNVVDAFRWILGEQSAKSLRGTEMADVIFGGTENRPSSGYAEASLFILNDKNILPIEYQEVCITRRLYASGESEYSINKQQCRLRDIKELFMDTGVGVDCYSVIEQGRVDTLLQVNAQERRNVFEEAAGISKYKARKKAASSKLEKVDQNLLRLGDIIEEVQKQSRSVTLQAAKARRYQEHVERLKELRIKLSLKNYREFKEKKIHIASQIGEVQKYIQSIQCTIEALEVERDSLEENITQLDTDISEVQANLANTEAQISTAHEKVRLNQQRIHEFELQKVRHSEHVQLLTVRIEELRKQAAVTSQNITGVEQEIEDYKSQLQLKETGLKQLTLECDLLRQQMEEKKSLTVDLLYRESGLQNEIGNLATKKETLFNRKARLQKRQDEISTEISQLAIEKQRMLNEKQGLNQEIITLTDKLLQSKGRIGQLAKEIESIEGQINIQKQLQSSRESRYEVLKDFEARSEGVEAGAKAILEEVSKSDAALTGIQGIVADLLKVDLPYAVAIETVLGTKVQSIVTNTFDDAIQALNFLREGEKGKATFLPLDRIRRNGTGESSILNQPGVIGKASNLVSHDDAYSEVIKFLLGDTIVVHDFDTAQTLYLQGTPPCTVRFVTTKGELIDSDGTLIGGKGEGQIGIISRKSELVSIEKELEKIAQSLERLEEERRVRSEDVKGLECELEALKQAIDKAKFLELAKDNELQQSENKHNNLLSEKGVNASEISEIEATVNAAQQREEKLRGELDALNDERRQLEQQLEHISTEVGKKEELKSALQNEITELKVNLAQRTEKRDGLTAALRQLESVQKETREDLSSTQLEIENCQTKKTEAEIEIKCIEDSLKDLQSKNDELSLKLISLKDGREAIHEQLLNVKTKIDGKNGEHKTIENQLQELRLRENELHVKMIDMEERIRDEYHIELSAADQPEGEGAVAEQSIKQEEIDWDNVAQEIEGLRGKIERLGNVNLEAIQQQDELQIREKFLLNQREDLQKAQNALNELIKRINTTSCELFEKTFNQVRENFRVLFRKLFGGGKADIILEEGVDMLEAGIEIIAQPPEKELRSVNLLSGGEKVMTTVALLFAIFQARPSPFCILDEVDAALDESNINRFIAMLKEFTQHSQFLIITHNKQTMSIADVLYGVTMQEPGVSKRITVKFEEIENRWHNTHPAMVGVEHSP